MKVDFDAALLTSPERFSRCSHSKNGVQLLNAKLRWRIAPEGSGAVRRIPFGKSEANSHRPLLPPLGEVPRSGKGGGVGIFELFPFNEPHPLSQPCRFRSAVKSASSPIGEPRWLLRIRPSLYKNIGACRNPSVSPFGLPAPLSGEPSGACTYSPGIS